MTKKKKISSSSQRPVIHVLLFDDVRCVQFSMLFFILYVTIKACKRYFISLSILSPVSVSLSFFSEGRRFRVCVVCRLSVCVCVCMNMCTVLGEYCVLHTSH